MQVKGKGGAGLGSGGHQGDDETASAAAYIAGLVAIVTGYAGECLPYRILGFDTNRNSA